MVLDNEEETAARILGVVPLLSSRAEVKEDPSRAAEYTQHRSCHHTFTLDTNTSLEALEAKEDYDPPADLSLTFPINENDCSDEFPDLSDEIAPCVASSS